MEFPMNLDDNEIYEELDPDHMLAEIEALPDQLLEAWALGQSLTLPDWQGIERVLIVGMGGSAIGADLLTAYLAPHCPVPVGLLRNYDLPAWATDPQTLVICSSHSGTTEETCSAFHQAVARGCRVLVVTTGGDLAVDALERGAALWIFKHQGQPRAAVGYSFGLLFAVFYRLGLIQDPENELAGAIAAMRVQQEFLGVDLPVMENPAKRLAGQCFGRWVAVFGSDFLVPVARRWKGQINELAKSWAQFEELPEADHNTLAGVLNPESALFNTFAIFLRAEGLHPRNGLRSDFTKEIFMLEGIGTDFFDAPGKNPLEQLWTALHFGDYMAYYLAIAYGVNPSQVEAIASLKARLQASQ
jgi:glucose/mannose-6-phosphate isomerase